MFNKKPINVVFFKGRSESRGFVHEDLSIMGVWQGEPSEERL
jgi:hypothetical protein